jgi:hypothetical protein
MATVKILKYQSIKGSSILTYTTPTNLIEQLIEKSRRKVEDGVEGFMVDFCVRYFKKTDEIISNETPKRFIKSLIHIKFIEEIG